MTTPSSSAKVTLKLLIDKRTNRVVYGEAGKDFVDFLFTILSLPLGTVTKLLSKDNNTMVGTLGNMCRSIEELSNTYIESHQSKAGILNPLRHYSYTSPITHLFTDQGIPAKLDYGGGYVKGIATYMVMDNLEVQVVSTMSIIALFNKMNIKDVGSIEVKIIHLGTADGLDLLKASLQTETVLTTVFLPKFTDSKVICGITY